MSHILLVRHGQNEWVSAKRLAGWTPGIHLNEQGLEEVNQLSARLVHLPIKAVYSSPLERCIETADIIANAHQLVPVAMEDLGEVHYGKWEGKKLKKLSKKRSWYAVQHFPGRFQFPNGEALRNVQNRGVNAIETLAGLHAGEMIAVVSHADVIKLVLAHYLGVHIDLFQRISVAPASVSILALSKKGPLSVIRMNDTGPIQPPQNEEKRDSS